MQYVILTDKPTGATKTPIPIQSGPFRGLQAVCSLPANDFKEALDKTMGNYWFLGGFTMAVPGEFIWDAGRVVGVNLYNIS